MVDMQVTISLLPVSLSLVHIPRSRLPQLSHPVLKQILHPNPVFLSITCNQLELSLIGDESLLSDFEPIARRDRRRQRSRSGSTSSRANHFSKNSVEPVEVSYEKWSVLQIDSHNDQLDNSGARVNELSALLAAAGISILYQSSYMSDFIFVRESRLPEAMALFAAAGFDVYTSDSDLSASQSQSALSSDSQHNDPSPIQEENSATDEINDATPSSSLFEQQSIESHASSASTGSACYSPTDAEVCLLSSDLACVGLSDEFGVDHWGLKIVKLVAFPDLISPSSKDSQSSLTFASLYPSPSTPLFDFSPLATEPASQNSPKSNSSDSSSTDDGYFSHSPPMRHLPLKPKTARSSLDLSKPPTSPRSSSKHPLTSFISLPHIDTGVSGPCRCVPKKDVPPKVPFFTYTKTSEGSSLTADVYVLAALFPPSERHMVICSGELDAADDRLSGRSASSDESHNADEDEDSSYLQGSLLKCLQIDLRRFGLDKYGLVNRFSRVLEENGVNHMYSSTFKTANLLVDKKQAARAEALLRAC